MNTPAFLQRLLRRVVPPMDSGRSAERKAHNAIELCKALLSERGEVSGAALARDALDRLVATTQPAGTDFALGVEARSGALVSGGDAAEPLFHESIERLGRTSLRPELARARLLYGEWLRREGRRGESREQLRIAEEMFTEMGMEAFADRTGAELVATGAKPRTRHVDVCEDLTPQEEQIAHLARDGLTNADIGNQLFLSPRTVGYHLYKAYPKLGIVSRGELAALGL
jgi:DNA-binding CsgD family transcriptional regulator